MMNAKENKLIEIYFYIIIIFKIIELTNILPEDNIINILMVGLGCVLLFYMILRNDLKIQYTYPIELKIYIVFIIVTLILNYHKRH